MNSKQRRRAKRKAARKERSQQTQHTLSNSEPLGFISVIDSSATEGAQADHQTSPQPAGNQPTSEAPIDDQLNREVSPDVHQANTEQDDGGRQSDGTFFDNPFVYRYATALIALLMLIFVFSNRSEDKREAQIEQQQEAVQQLKVESEVVLFECKRVLKAQEAALVEIESTKNEMEQLELDSVVQRLDYEIDTISASIPNMDGPVSNQLLKSKISRLIDFVSSQRKIIGDNYARYELFFRGFKEYLAVVTLSLIHI